MKRLVMGRAAAMAAVCVPALAWASNTPLYQPAPAWVVAPPPVPAGAAEELPPIVLLDFQQRIEGDRLWSYVHQQTRIASSEMLSQAATLTLPWAPDKGDLIVHGLTILRGDQRIDLLAKGQKFVVLRREQSLEQRALTGILTATMAVEGLEVGDILDIKGTRSVMLDTALRDCTSAIELSDSTLAALDSRAMVWYRMGRYPEALADLDAVLAAEPDMAGSRYLRAAVLKAMKRDADAVADLTMARRVAPQIDRQYARFGFKM